MDQHAFVTHILASPGDDGPRLVFADWLEERGDPRGEVLRAMHDSSDWRHRALVGAWKAGWDLADSSATIPEDLPAAIAPLAATMILLPVLPVVTPAWDRIETWPDGLSAARATEVIQRTLAVSELVALGFLPRDAASSARNEAFSTRDAAWNSINAAVYPSRESWHASNAAWYALNAVWSASRAALYALEAAVYPSRASWYASNAAWYASRAVGFACNAAGPAYHDAFQARNATSSAAAALFGSAQWAELAQLLVPVAA